MCEFCGKIVSSPFKPSLLLNGRCPENPSGTSHNWIETQSTDTTSENINDVSDEEQFEDEEATGDEEPTVEDIAKTVGRIHQYHQVIDKHESENAEIDRQKDLINQLKEETERLKTIIKNQEKASINKTGIFSALSHGKLIIFGMGIISVLVVLVGILWSTHSLFVVNDITNIDVIVTAVEACGEVTTYRAYFESVADKKEDGWFGRWRQFVIIFGGTVDCGFEMQKAKIDIFDEKVNDSNEKKRKVIVTLPHCKVLRTHVDLENDKKNSKKAIRIYDQQGGWFSSALTLEEQNEVVAEALKQIRNKAIGDWNVIGAAEKNAREMYKRFLEPFNCEVVVRFTNNPKELSVPSGNNFRHSKSGGVIVFHDQDSEK